MQLVFDPRFRRMVDFLSLESVELEEPHVPEKIMFLYDYAERKAKSSELEMVMSKLKSIKKQTGDTLRGKPLLRDMYQIARLDSKNFLAQDEKAKENETEQERKEREIRIAQKESKRIKDWQDMKDSLKQEKENKDLENIMKTNYVARMIKSEDKQQSKTNVNYKIAKDDTPQAVRVKPYDTGE